MAAMKYNDAGVFDALTEATKDVVRGTPQSILDEADGLINGDRRTAYGDPRVSLNAVASLWDTYMSVRFGITLGLNAEDVCQLMALLKLSRELTGESKRDNLVDQAGYIGLVGKIRYETGGS